MNNIYKVIWSASLGTWIAVSELAKAKTKSSTVTTILGSAALILMVSFSPTAMACGSCGGGGNSGGDPGNSTDGWKINIDATGTGTQISSGISPAIVRNGDEVKFIAGNNIELNQAGRQIKIATNPNLISDSITTGDSILNTNGLTITGGPSVTKGGINAGSKVITHVASGGTTITNAANIGDVKTAIDNSTTTLTTAGLNFAGNSGSNVHRDLGQTLAVKGGFTEADTATSNENVKTVTTADGIDIRLAKNAVFDSITTGDSVLNSNGLTINGGPSVTKGGINAGGKVITHVANGVADLDAVNVSQLNSTNQNVTDLNNQTFKLQANGDTATAVKSSDTVQFNDGENIKLTRSGNNITVATNPNLISDSITTGDSILNTNGLTITGGPSITTGGINAGNKIISNVASGGTTITNAANIGDVNNAVTNTTTTLTTAGLNFSGNSGANVHRDLGQTLAVKGGFIGADTDTSSENVKTVTTADGIDIRLAKNAVFDSMTTGDSVLNSNGLTINGGPSVTKGGINAGGKVITHVANGVADLDAVNISQLNSTNQNVTDLNNQTFKLQANGDTATAVKSSDTVQFKDGENIKLTRDGNNITVATNPNLISDSITTGDSVLNSNGLTIIGGPSITTGGINAGNKIISNVASGGTTITNAANIGDVNNAVTNTTTTLTTAGLNFAGNSGSNVHRDLGQTLAVKGGFTGADTDTSSENVKTVTTADGIDIQLAKNAVFDSITTGDSVLNSNGLTIIGGPSITKSGINAGSKVINNVANGVVASDAVNLGQLNSTNQNVTDLNNQTFKLQTNGDAATAVKSSDTVQFKDGENIKLTRDGNNITVATAATVSFDQVAVGSVVTDKMKGTIVGLSNKTLSATDFATVGRAASEEQLKLVSNVANNANQGWKINTSSTGTGTVSGSSSTSVAPGDAVDFIAGNNIALTQAGKSITVALNPNLVADSITTGNSKLDNNGLTITGGPSVTTAGINAGNQVITNVATGVAASDAVNVGQLNSAVSNIQNNVNQINDQAVLYNKNPDETIDKDNITLAGGSNGTGIHNLADGVVAAGSKDAVNGGQLADVRDNLQGQIDITTNYLTNIQTTLDSGSIGLVQQVGGPKGPITVAQDTGGSVVNVSGTDGNRVVTGVANGAVTATSTDAINGSQLNSTNQAVVSYLGGGAGYDNITGSFNAPTYNVDNKPYNNVGSAIDALNQADQNLNTKIDNVSNKLDDAFRATNDRIDRVEERANAGIAAAMALEAAPYIPGKYTYAVGAAYHHSENAVGVTLRKTADNGRWSVTGGVAVASQGDPSVRIGISGVIN